MNATAYYYLNAEGQPEGPIAREELRQLLSDGMISRDTQIAATNGQWKPVRAYPEFIQRSKPIPPPTSQPHYIVIQQPAPPASDGLAVVVILTILIWPLGIIAAIVYACTGRMGNAVLVLALSIACAIFSYAIWSSYYH